MCYDSSEHIRQCLLHTHQYLNVWAVKIRVIVIGHYSLHTCAAESIDCKCVASVARASVGAISVDTAMLTKMKSFIALMYL